MRYDGESQASDVLSEQRFAGDLLQVMRSLDQLAKGLAGARPLRQTSMVDTTVQDYPPLALHELLMNAVAHRNYDNSTTPISVNHFSDRIEIQNPGSLVYHLAWMFRELGQKVLAIDLDPQSNLTSAFLGEDELERLWPQGSQHAETMLGAIDPLIQRLGDVLPLEARRIADGLFLLPGDLGLSLFEDRLSEAWRTCLDDNPANAGDGFRVMTAFHRVIKSVADAENIDITLVDVGPNVGAMNRAALVAADQVVIPLGADLFSLQGLSNLGPTLRKWRAGWHKRKDGQVPKNLPMPNGDMKPLGYVLLNPSVRSNRPVKAYRKWADRIPAVYAIEVLGTAAPTGAIDANQLSMVKHFKSLMPMAQDARKPMFLLKPADGAIGGHAAAVQDCFTQFRDLAQRILAETT